MQKRLRLLKPQTTEVILVYFNFLILVGDDMIIVDNCKTSSLSLLIDSLIAFFAFYELVALKTHQSFLAHSQS